MKLRKRVFKLYNWNFLHNCPGSLNSDNFSLLFQFSIELSRIIFSLENALGLNSIRDLLASGKYRIKVQAFVISYIKMSQNRNFHFKISSSCGWKFCATALWDKNLKFPSAQVCPLFFSFLYQPFYVTPCHFVSFYATKISAVARKENNSSK